MAMDDTDRQLIAMPRKDARTHVTVLAARLEVLRGTVTNRWRKLEDEHVIVGLADQAGIVFRAGVMNLAK